MKNQRRDFINQGLRSLGKMLIENEIPEPLKEAEEKVKMLTPDGKLVEINPNHINSRSKASNQEILKWMDNNSSSKQSNSKHGI